MVGILDLPDEMLVKILLYNQHDSILNIAEISPRFALILNHSSLWIRVYFRNPVDLSTLKNCLKYMGSYTRTLKITGNLKRPRPLLKSNFSDVFFRDLQCPNLVDLRLEYIYCEKRSPLKVKNLPDGLERLRFDTVEPISFRFIDLKEKIRNLRVLELVRCPWFTANLLYFLICTLPHLQNISVSRCTGLRKSFVAQPMMYPAPPPVLRISSTFKELSLVDCFLYDGFLGDNFSLNLLQSLQSLDLRDNPEFTNRGLDIFASQLVNSNQEGIIKKLNLCGTGVTQDAVDRFRSKFTNYTVDI
ncbi:uncharacterized protein LOC111710047 isoform X2 [Eurytemora carolleeae]|uniref:uncharacterized protein LOC111710047 isoform X2 n=1 Tax=Eurytemora carolleeae TaxID=1294199 RepID=UPI000C77CB76|nr:uncharacterized protein LOC111710047 isoform X2 [Eurytemora carolleeae]|eukprot:XP_023339829.1 uncharacterized protein LOC111710047 isoform X2 [Eurytemora affinis]